MGGASKPSTRRSKSQIERDRMVIARRMLEGVYQEDIATELGVSQSTISNEKKKIEEMWLVSSLVDFNEVRARELARVDELERMYRECIARDLLGTTRTSKKVKSISVPNDEVSKLIVDASGKLGEKKGRTIVPIETEAHETKQTRNVNPAYLQGIQWCITTRAKLYGFDKPQETTEMPDLDHFFAALTGSLDEIWEAGESDES